MHLQAARGLVDRYLAAGGGDEEGLYNLTPRYQAARIYQTLGLRQQAIAFYTHVVQGVAKESKMRFAHFGRERGLLPHTFAENLIMVTKRLRMAEAMEADR